MRAKNDISVAEWLSRRKTPKKNKYHVSPPEARTVDGITFDSKKEMERYLELKQLRADGDVRFFLRQVPFHLSGKTKYLADFVVFWNRPRNPNTPIAWHVADGFVTVEDCKGVKTEVYRLKKRQVEALYPVEIKEI